MTVTPPRARARARSRRGEGDRLREEILEAAERLLISTGSEDAVSIRAVARAVGVTAPSIYRHFPDKQHLLFDVCARHFERLARFLDAAGADVADPVDALAVKARAYVRFGVENPEHYRIMFMGRSELTPEEYADELLMDSSAFGGLVRAVDACVASGAFRRDLSDPLAISLVLWAVVHGITSLAVAKPGMPGPALDERVALMLDVTMSGLLAEPRAGRSGRRR